MIPLYKLIRILLLVLLYQGETLLCGQEFKQLTTGLGLPGSDIRSLYQDKKGYLWFAVDGAGLCRYDGKSYVTYGHLPDDPASLSNGFIWNIHADQYDNIWLATENGLNLFDRQHDHFFRFYCSKFASDNWIICMFSDKEGNMWIGTNSGMFQLEAKEIGRINTLITSARPVNQSDIHPSFKRHVFHDLQHKEMGVTPVYQITEDNSSRLWISTNNGLFMFDRKTGLETHFTHKDGDPHSLIDNLVRFVHECKTGIYIIGTNRGICRYVEKEKSFGPFSFAAVHHGELDLKGYSKFFTDSRGTDWIVVSDGILVGKNIGLDKQPSNCRYFTEGDWGLNSALVRDITEDSSGQIWIATKFGGIQILQNNQQIFPCFRIQPVVNKTNRVNDDYVLSLKADDRNNIWVSTKAGGLLRFDREKRRFESYWMDIDPVNPVHSNKFGCIYQDRQKDIWLGSAKGLYAIRNHGLKLTPFHKVSAINEDNSGHFWLGTDKGVFVFDKKKNSFARFGNGNPFFKDSSLLIYCITVDQQNQVWFGTFLNGIYTFDNKSGQVKHKQHLASDNQSLSGDMIRVIFNDHSGKIWIGTKDNGLNLYDKQKDSFLHYSVNDGLPSNTIFSMMEDKKGNIWIGTHQGLSMMNTKQMSFVNYDENQGLQSSSFEYNAYTSTSDGFLLFGGKSGFNMFHPDSIHPVLFKPSLVINYVKANDKIIRKELTAHTKLELPYDQNYLAFEFALLDYRNPSKNTYKYQLKGVDKGWVDAGNRNYIAYPKLKHGKYEFVVKSTGNKYGQKTECLSVEITINPPFWLTKTAYVVYFLLILAFLYGIFTIATIKANYTHRLSEAQKEMERAAELHQTKLRFFTNVSHEFQAPLTLIMAPVEKLIHSPGIGSEERKYVELIHKNTKRLSQLIDQLLYFRMTQNDVVELSVSEGNITGFLREISYPYSVQALKHNISFSYCPAHDPILLWFDPDKMEKIVSNLLMNAFKYTPQGGKITLKVDICDEYPQGFTVTKSIRASEKNHTYKTVKIEVTDTGRGMTAEETQQIFDRYYRACGNDGQKGVGLGLELTRTLIDMHSGFITVSSTPGAGSVFTVYFLPGKEHFHEKNISNNIFQAKDYISEVDIDYLGEVPETIGDQDLKNAQENDNPMILIVEDNNDLRNFLDENLNDHYQIIKAANGRHGLELALQHIPDLIISDVIMPEMDGIEMCRQVKNNIATSHVPILLLTRKAYIEDKITGLLTGAVDYIEKPFNMQYLQLRIQSLLSVRQKVNDQLKKELEEGEVKASDISVYDRKLLNKCKTVIMDNLSNTDFGVSELSREVGLSRSQLHRKITALTGQSPADMVYSTRLTEAKKLLAFGYSVTDVSHLTGFKSSNSFSTVFKKHFGMSPKDFTDGKKKINSEKSI